MPDITTIKIGKERERSYKNFPANREFKKRAEDDNPGGGWPADLPKPSVGGYGYTEQGDGAVITWDGDTEGRESVTISGTMYKVSNQIITQSDVIGGEFGTSMGIIKPITEAQIIDFTSGGIENAFGIAFAVDTPTIGVMCVQNDTVFGDTPISAGVYFLYADAYVSSLTYGTPDTIHKIDEKYLPEAGGAMVVNAFYNENTDSYVVDKTLEEIYRSSPNVKLVIRAPEDGLHTVLNLISASMDGVSFETVLHSFGMDGTITGINCTAINISPDGYVEYNEGSIAF